MNDESAPSADLVAANRRLLKLRAVHQSRQAKTTPLPHQARPLGLAEVYEVLPSHLGWESAPASAVVRRTNQSGESEPEPLERDGDKAPLSAASLSYQEESETFITLFPTLALATLREGHVTSGRLWFLLRHLDRDGRGWIGRSEANKAFTGRASPLRFCSRRHLARLLADGEGLFWTADKERIWVRGQAKVAAALGIERLCGRPVAVPLDIFLARIGDLKAHFYTAFHSSRAGEREYGPPIARETISAVTGVPRRTQRYYERRAGLRVQPNIALGPAASGRKAADEAVLSTASAVAQELAWRRGQAYFRLTDRRGQYGHPGQTYHAWRLPNSYRGPHYCLPRSRQRRLNRQLADLCRKRGTGNSEVAQRPARCFFPNGAAAGRAWSRRRAAVAYWPFLSTRQKRCQLWGILEAC